MTRQRMNAYRKINESQIRDILSRDFDYDDIWRELSKIRKGLKVSCRSILTDKLCGEYWMSSQSIEMRIQAVQQLLLQARPRDQTPQERSNSTNLFNATLGLRIDSWALRSADSTFDGSKSGPPNFDSRGWIGSFVSWSNSWRNEIWHVHGESVWDDWRRTSIGHLVAVPVARGTLIY